MIAFWPKVIRSKGGISRQTGHVMDFMRTFIDAAHTSYPREYKGYAITPTTGISLLPAFQGKSQPHKTLYNEHFGARYVREENWKLVSLSTDSSWHLYDIEKDQTEIHDLAAEHADVVQRLSQKWQQWAVTNKVFPKKKP